MEASCGGWSALWRLCDTPTASSDDTGVSAMIPSCVTLESYYFFLPSTKVVLSFRRKSGVSFLYRTFFPQIDYRRVNSSEQKDFLV